MNSSGTLSPSVRVSPTAEEGTGWRFAKMEYYTLALMISVATATYIFITGDTQSERLLTPALVAAIMVANLVPAMTLLVLIGSRLARARAVRSLDGGTGRLHVRLVALFSLIAAAPTLLVVIFASLLFQYGVDFWFSGKSRGMFENAASLAQGYYQENQKEVEANTLTMAHDLNKVIKSTGFDDPDFKLFYLQQVVFRSLNESAIIEVSPTGNYITQAIIDPDERVASQRISPETIKQLDSGTSVVTLQRGDKIEASTKLDGPGRLYLYASRDANVLGLKQYDRARTVLADYNALFRKSQQLQLRFNLALYLGSLLLLALAVVAAIVVADRIVRPLGRLVGAASTAAGGDLSVRVTPPLRDDEIAVLTRAFNRMTEQLQGQTGALLTANEQLEARRTFIETVLSGVSSAVISIDSSHRIQLANASAERLICGKDGGLIGQRLDDVAPELAGLLGEGEPEAVVQLARGDGEPRTLAAKAVALGEGYVLSFEDITQQLLDQRRAAWSDVARRIAHEIKNPLTPIQLAAERLQRRFGDKINNDPATFRKLTDTIIRQVADLRRMVDEFSSFARMPKPNFGVEDIWDIVRKSVFLFEVAKPDIIFSVTVDGDPEPLVCDRRLLSQAITNIVKNAVEAIEERRKDHPTSAQGHVRANIVETEEGSLQICVSDDGIGLPKERESIIEPYMTTRQGGTGLGLAIVKKIVEQHFGELEFSDVQAGQGTQVVLTLYPARLRPLAGQGGDGGGAGQGESVPGRIRNRSHKIDREENGA